MKSSLFMTALLAGTTPAVAATPAAKVRNVAIVVYEGAEILDFAGPSEVLQAAGSFAETGAGSPLNVYVVGRKKEAVTVQGFIKVVPQYSIEDAPKPEVVVIPGGQSSALSDDEMMFSWLKKSVADAEVTLTVCTGAFPLAKMGVLDGLEVTTFYGAIDALAKIAPKTKVTPGRRFIDNGKYITTAGVSAGIDGSLHLVARLLGRRVADRTAQYMEYRWTPETYLASSYSYLNPSADERGRMLQTAEMAFEEKQVDRALEMVRQWLAANPKDSGVWHLMGGALAGMGKFDDALAAYQHVDSTSPKYKVALYNSACAAARSGKKSEAITYLKKSLAAGFSAEHAKHDPDLDSIRDEVNKLASR